MTEAEKEARREAERRYAPYVDREMLTVGFVAGATWEASRAPQPTEDERRIPGFAERERGAQAAWEFFARDDRDVSRDFRAGYHQGTIDEARRRAPAEPAVQGDAKLPQNSDVTDEMVERAAHTLFERAGASGWRAGWYQVSPETREMLREDARAALEAALSTERGEWEYGYRLVGDDGNVYKRGFAYDDPRDASERGRARVIEENEVHEANGMPRLSFELIRRRKAGPWEPVTPEEEQ